ncbi:histidine kinase [Brevibacillus sp. SKDU10]|uniref:sensor domain-containing protein n=1 Tax=Brevibacillus sp. SKDU10 TaxID=1247872 RepID=UPI0007C95A2F|nr:sensor domain-containing protein [Brevibacillus sp. SKDU10]OAJ75699.1 histidine kinase [Brevibacillus sp. SKDU10]
MTKESAQKSLQDFYFLLFTFGLGLFYICFYLASITFALMMTVIFVGIPLLASVLRTTHTFVQYERIQTKVYTDISKEPILPRTKDGGDKWIEAREAILSSSNWRAIFWLMQKIFIRVISLICAVIFYVVPLAFIVIPLLFQYLEIYILGIAVNSWEKAIYVMIAGCIIAWIGNSCVQIVGIYTRFMFKAIKG